MKFSRTFVDKLIYYKALTGSKEILTEVPGAWDE